MKRAVIAVALSVVVALLSANVNTVAHAQGELVAPSNVAAQHTGNPGEVRISWDAVPDAAYYRIGWVAYADVEPIIAAGGDWLEHFAFIDIENRGQTEHVITRLTPGVVYAFIMASNDGRYGTPRWPTASGWAFLTLNEAPTTHASLGSTAINLKWNAVPGAEYYRIGWVVYEDVAPIIASGGDWLEHFAFIDISNRDQTAHTITRLTSGLLYAFIVAGNDGRYGKPQWPDASGWQFMTPSPAPLATGPDTDRAALVALYDTTGGTNWTDNTNWGGNSSIGEWYGVTTNDDGRVTELRLHQNNLSGQIPAALGNLSNLEVLLLLDNGLTGPIPPALGSLSNVRIFYLYQNQLMGDMPSSLGNLSNLERFSVRDNLLSGEIPSWLGNLTKLDWLRLDGNDFTGPIPPALGRLSNLTSLILGGNRLTGSVPSWLGGMGSLELLALNDNQLTGEIPAELGNLVNLQLIWLGGNALTGCVPAALQNVADNDLDLLELPNCSEETIVTGFGMDIFDKAIPGLMTKWNIPGGAVALSRNGKLLLAKGYGYADIENREQVQPDSLFRIASLSKPITAVAVLKLVEDGHLNLDDRVFDILDQFEPPGGTIADPRIREVTVRQLLQHSGGWDRERSFDPMFRLGQIERELGVAKPVSCADVIRFMLIRPLDFDPGTDYRYSNFGYCILGRVIEAKTGHSYEAYVKNAVLNPVGITGMRIGGALLNERSEGEVRYYGYTGQSLADSVIPGTPQRVPWEYGGFSLQTMDSNGGWLASTMDLLRFVTALDESREPLILRSETVDTMTARPDIDRWRDSPWHYAMGWLVRPVNDDANWWHTGSLPGTRTLLVRIYPGMAWAVLFNSSPHDSEQMARELNELMWKVTSETSQWPSHDLFPRYGYE